MNRAHRVFDSRGNLLGDDALPPDLQSMVDEAGASSNPNVVTLPPTTITGAIPGFDLSSLLQPPYIYLIVGAIAAAAYWYSKEHS